VDCISMALRYLRRTGLIERREEAEDSQNNEMMHRGAPPAPLYVA